MRRNPTFLGLALSILLACGSSAERSERTDSFAEQVERARDMTQRARERSRTEAAEAAEPAKAQRRPERRESEAVPPVVELLDAGAGPRSPLRYRLSTGTATTLHVTHRLSGTVSSDERGGEPVEKMSLEFSVTVSVGAIVGDGVHALEVEAGNSRFGWADASPGMVGLLNEEASSATLQIAGEVNDRGILSGFSQAPWQGLPMDLLWVVLPKEPVGDGGRWRVTYRTPIDFGDLVQTVEYTIESRTATEVVLSAAFSERLADDETNDAGHTRQALKADDFTGTGTGKITLSLENVVPKNVESTIEAKIGFKTGASTAVTKSTAYFKASQK